MARKRKSPETDQSPEVTQGRYWLPNDAAWGGFINLKLDDEAKVIFGAWAEFNRDNLWVMVDDVLGAGMKLGLSYDRENSCYILTFTGALVGGSNERYCMTTRASTLSEVFELAVWKHQELCGGEYGDFRPRSGKMLNWG
jgi:hypothetical protein